MLGFAKSSSLLIHYSDTLSMFKELLVTVIIPPVHILDDSVCVYAEVHSRVRLKIM